MICIGLPVFNAENFICKRLENILSQTCQDFKLIISDNASTDHTSEICLEYEKKDKRISYIKQNNNIGIYPNFVSILKDQNTKYFIWAAVDDLWDPNYLKKNLQVLEFDQKFVGSISRVGRMETQNNNLVKEKKTFYSKYAQQIKKKFASPFDLKKSLVGTFQQKSHDYLRNKSGLSLYCLFRTDSLKKSVVLSDLLSIYEPSIIFRILKLGDINVIDEILFYWYPDGISTSGKIGLYLKNGNMSIFDIIFPETKFTFWCFKNIGFTFFFRNIDYFAKLYLQSSIGLIQELKKYLQFVKNKSKYFN
jgi:glycosyltransferase involved in cell wall biosynthesis